MKNVVTDDDDEVDIGSLNGVKKAGYCTDEWSRWQQGSCGTYALGLQRLNPKLKFGVMDGGSHFYAHDATHAYDSAGKHPLPYHGIAGHAEDSILDEDPKDYCLPWDESGPEGPEVHVQAAMEHAKRNGILEGRHNKHGFGKGNP